MDEWDEFANFDMEDMNMIVLSLATKTDIEMTIIDFLQLTVHK